MKKRFLLFALLLLVAATASAQGMSDEQVMNFIASEAKAGTSQSQIFTKLIQRGVKIDQIRRLRNQYDKQIREKGMSAVADGAVSAVANRMRSNNDGTTTQEMKIGRAHV